ncbi:MAG: sensor histidine kinase, partial [Sulfurimonas sp.]|nr:sensor histidine kinase [Sulfurimonas sp.]
MKKILNALQINFIRKDKSTTIKQANLFTTLYILLFTIVFVSVLIKENYEEYEKTLVEQRIMSDYNENNVDAKSLEIEKELKSLMIKKTLSIATLAFILFAIMLGFYKLFNAILQRDIDIFMKFFKESAHTEQKLNPQEMFFEDFKIMVGYANSMVETISEQKHTLRDLNQGLEEKVLQKMSKLESINENLKKEKKFSQDLLKSQKEFLRYTVHETNTPLSVILMSIELYLMKNPRDRQLSKIEAAVKNIFSIYDDLS